jgi:hypothetical protein
MRKVDPSRIQLQILDRKEERKKSNTLAKALSFSRS